MNGLEASRILENPESLKLEGFALGFPEDGNVGVGVFPKRKEILIGCACLGVFAFERVSSAEAEMRSEPIASLTTMPLLSSIFWNSAAAALPSCAARYACARI